ncbi:MAG: DUF6673 family protein [Clostridia bacterium]
MSQNESRPSLWTYNGVELELDMTAPEVIDRYENAFALMDKEIKSGPKDGKKSDIVRYYCSMIRRVFDRIFGEGTSVKLVGEQDSATTLTSCYEDFLNFVALQNDTLMDMTNRISNRFSPNRAQRRAAKK